MEKPGWYADRSCVALRTGSCGGVRAGSAKADLCVRGLSWAGLEGGEGTGVPGRTQDSSGEPGPQKEGGLVCGTDELGGRLDVGSGKMSVQSLWVALAGLWGRERSTEPPTHRSIPWPLRLLARNTPRREHMCCYF